MQLASTNVKVERHGEIVETDFNIGDPWLLLEYMTKNVYSDIHRVVVQEIGSNARDAHREIGQTRPIRIKLPNRFSPTLEFRDWGPGMGPDRIHGIFKSYGRSSKRGDNVQTGGFGIGGKTPWAYTDVFNIRTIALENGTLTLREYSAIKGEDRSLKLMELGDPTPIDVNDPNVHDDDKHTGTTISIVAKQEDWHIFENKVIEITKWWKPEEKPEIVGKDPAPTYPDMSVMYEGNGWKVLNVAHRNEEDSSYYNRSGQPTVVVDGISYTLQRNSLNLDNHLSKLMDGRIVLFFNVGELTLALSRENLQYDERTKNALVDRLKNVYDALVVQVSESLKSCTSLRQAILKFQEMQANFAVSQFVEKAEWNGISVDRQRFHFDYSDGATIREYTQEGNAATGYKIRSKESYHIAVNNDSLIVFNDTNETKAVLRLYTLFHKHPEISTIQVVTPRGGVDYDKNWEEKKQAIHWDMLEVINFSTVEKFKREYIGGKNTHVIKAYAYTGTSRHNVRAMWSEVDVDMENGEGVYVTLDRGVCVDFNHDSLYRAYRVAELKTSLIGVPARFVGKLGPGWTKLKDHFKEKMDEVGATLDLKAIAEYQKLSHLMFENSYGILESNLDSLVDDQDCSLVKWIKRSRDIQKMEMSSAQRNAFNKYESLAGYAGVSVQLPEIVDDLESTVEHAKAYYPMILAMIAHARYMGGVDAIKEELATYINARNQSLTLKAESI